MTNSTSIDILIGEVRQAFADEPALDKSNLVAAKFASGIDADEMVYDLAGKRWDEIEQQLFFFHRETIRMLSPVGYRSLLGGFLTASLTGDEELHPDLVEYILFSLHPLRGESPTDTDARLAALSPQQIEVVGAYLRTIVARFGTSRASEILEAWNKSGD